MMTEKWQEKIQETRRKAGQDLYDQLARAHAILSDRDYVISHGGTAQVRAELQAESFLTFGGGTHRLKRLLELYRDAPRKIWEQYNYDWEAVARHVKRNAKPKPPRGPRHDYKAERDELALENAILKRQLADTQEQLRQAQQRIGELSCGMTGETVR